jgi:uracil-DNA glycosylase
MPLLQGAQSAFQFDGVSQTSRLTQWSPQQWLVASDWRALVDGFLASEAGLQLGGFMRKRLEQGALIYPPQPFRALELSPLAQVKVLILGQDPYHGLGQAQGLAFSVAPGVKPPPSLRNIFKEIARDPLLQGKASAMRGDGSLECWARQGVLLLNTCLTVEEGRPASHAQQGWEVLTDAIVAAVAEFSKAGIVFLLWGAHAQSKRKLIEAAMQTSHQERPHLVLVANHPSPLSALRPPTPFLGCGHFGACNNFLALQNHSPIDW